LRKGLFAIVLVAASFAGGAAINGPGLEWAQAQLARFQGSPEAAEDSDSDPVEVDERGEAAAAEKEEAASPPEDVPAAPLAALVPEPSKAEAPKGEPQPLPRLAERPLPTVPTPGDSSAGPAPDLAAPNDLDPKAVGLNGAAGRDEAPTAANAAQRVAAAPSAPAPADDIPPPSFPGRDRGWGDAPGSAPAKAALPDLAKVLPGGRVDASVTPAVMGPGPGGPGPEARSDWAALRKRMREAGVSRYWIEGEPGGVSRFRCVIPLAGRQAVGQQFEAEGDDEIQAAEAALRRVALWRATEGR
jgi:hypothetical protein